MGSVVDDLVRVVEHVLQLGGGVGVSERLAELLVKKLDLVHLLHLYFLFLSDMEPLLLFEFLLVLEHRLGVLSELHAADALL